MGSSRFLGLIVSVQQNQDHTIGNEEYFPLTGQKTLSWKAVTWRETESCDKQLSQHSSKNSCYGKAFFGCMKKKSLIEVERFLVPLYIHSYTGNRYWIMGVMVEGGVNFAQDPLAES